MKDKIYLDPFSETNAFQVKDWRKALDIPYNKADIHIFDDLYSAAADWEICACGNLCKSLPREPNGQPKDKKLAYLGSSFSCHVEDMLSAYDSNEPKSYELHRQEALDIHNKIELRAIEVLKELDKKRLGL